IFGADSLFEMMERIIAAYEGKWDEKENDYLDDLVSQYIHELKPYLKNEQKWKASTKAVFLTGASGFYGSFLLMELLKKTSARVWCLIRADNINAAWSKLINKLKTYWPEVTQDDLKRVE